jgi:hypothetical protein
LFGWPDSFAYHSAQEMAMAAWLRRNPPPLKEEKRRILEALADYPPYTPPNWNSEAQSAKDVSDEYKAYFLDNRNRRVETLRQFLAAFDVGLNLDDSGVQAVSAWFPLYADLLVDGLHHQEADDIWCAYHWFQAPWTNRLIGLNPIFDLGIYVGEYLLSRNSRLKWLPVLGPERNSGANHPIFGQRCRRPFDPIRWTYTECKNIYSARINKESPDLDRFHRAIKWRANE